MRVWKYFFWFYILVFRFLLASETEAFETLQVGFRIPININQNILHNYWSLNNSFELFAQTPFYYGHIEAGLHHIYYKRNITSVPNYRSFFIYLWYGKQWLINQKTSLNTGLRVGNYLMIFGRYQWQEENSNESEFSTAYTLDFRRSINDNIRISVSLSRQVVYTHKHIDLTFGSIGISYAIETPLFIKQILR